jgi:tryptophan-rich sensory protein
MNTSIIIILLPFILGFISSLFINKNNIPSVKSPVNPPKWLFGVVWPILYLLLGYSSYLIYQSKAVNKNKIFTLYIIHIILLSIWFPVFVNYYNRYLSFVSIIFILLYAIYLYFEYTKISIRASYCLIPYILWLCFASYLTYYSY